MAIKTTKSLLLGLIVLLTILLFLQACKKDGNENSDLIGAHILKKDVLKSLIANDQKIEITATDFQATGCPPQMNCLLGGYSKVKIKFKDNTQQQTLELCKGLCIIIAKPLQEVITLNSIKYNVKLEEILPEYNSEKETIETPKAYIVITKVN